MALIGCEHKFMLYVSVRIGHSALVSSLHFPDWMNSCRWLWRSEWQLSAIPSLTHHHTLLLPTTQE
jgi:hypothetical protein